MKCQNCGTEFNEGIFCPECGTKYEEGNIKSQEQLVELEKIKSEQTAEIERLKTEQAEELERIKAAHAVELENAKVEAVKMAAVKAEQDVEIARQNMEQQKLESERLAKEKELLTVKMEREQRIKEANEGMVMGILSLVAGSVSLVTFGLFIFPEILGIIFAVLGRKQGKMRGTSIAGLVCSIIAAVLMVVVYALAFSGV